MEKNYNSLYPKGKIIQNIEKILEKTDSSARSISPNLKTIRDAQSYEFLPSITKNEVKKY